MKSNRKKKQPRRYIPIAELPPKKRAKERARLKAVHKAQAEARRALKAAQADSGATS